MVTTHEPRQARDTTLLVLETGRRIYVVGQGSLGEVGARRIRFGGLGGVILSKGCIFVLLLWIWCTGGLGTGTGIGLMIGMMGRWDGGDDTIAKLSS